MKKLALEGKKIIITRARQQAEQLALSLSEAGAAVLEFPVLDFVPPTNLEPLQQALEALPQYNWLIFTSANGVNFFAGQAQQSGVPFPANLKIAVVGTTTAKALQNWGLTPTLLPEEFSAEGLVRALPNIQGKRVLLPQADIARDTLVKGLRERGAVVHPVVAYCTVMAQEQPSDPITARQLADWLTQSEVDLIIFASPSAVQFFAEKLTKVSNVPLPVLLNNTLVAAIGNLTATAVRQAGLTVALQPEVATTDALYQKILEYYQESYPAISSPNLVVRKV